MPIPKLTTLLALQFSLLGLATLAAATSGSIYTAHQVASVLQSSQKIYLAERTDGHVCNDSDHGKDYQKHGETEYKEGEKWHNSVVDTCNDERAYINPVRICRGPTCMLKEYYCDDNNIRQMEELHCPDFCEYGKCTGKASDYYTPDPIANTKRKYISSDCHDTDPTHNSYQTGATWVRSGPDVFGAVVDTCSDSQGNPVTSCSGEDCFLKEYHCTHLDKIDYKLYLCSLSCDRGICGDAEGLKEDDVLNKGYSEKRRKLVRLQERNVFGGTTQEEKFDRRRSRAQNRLKRKGHGVSRRQKASETQKYLQRSRRQSTRRSLKNADAAAPAKVVQIRSRRVKNRNNYRPLNRFERRLINRRKITDY